MYLMLKTIIIIPLRTEKKNPSAYFLQTGKKLAFEAFLATSYSIYADKGPIKCRQILTLIILLRQPSPII